MSKHFGSKKTIGNEKSKLKLKFTEFIKKVRKKKK